MAKGYTTVANVAAYLGRTLTTDQTTQAQSLLDVVEPAIDRETRQAWLIESVAAEKHNLTAPRIYLRYYPVASVTLVQTRTTRVGDTLVTLVAGKDYELIDPILGQIDFASGYGDAEPGYWDPTAVSNLFLGNAYALVTYVPSLPVPADISIAATEMVAAALFPTLFPDRLGISQAQVDTSTRLTYTEDGSSIRIPANARAILDGYRRVVVA